MTRAHDHGLGTTGAARTTMAAPLLSRLDRVKRTGDCRWIACCPAHDDCHPSLSVRELDDGRILVHCFAGCDVAEILGAVGLELSDLFPERPIEHGRRERMPFAALDVLRAITHEALIAAVAASSLARGLTLSDADRERLLTAAARLQRAVEVCDE
jgi:hypothetical protein